VGATSSLMKLPTSSKHLLHSSHHLVYSSQLPEAHGQRHGSCGRGHLHHRVQLSQRTASAATAHQAATLMITMVMTQTMKTMRQGGAAAAQCHHAAAVSSRSVGPMPRRQAGLRMMTMLTYQRPMRIR
jgi:hypothetical protein